MLRVLACCLVLAGCAATPPPLVTPADAERGHLPIAELQQGRDLLVGKCGGCHDVPLPDQQPRAAWPEKVGAMVQRSGIAPAQRQLIEQYLIAMDPR